MIRRIVVAERDGLTRVDGKHVEHNEEVPLVNRHVSINEIVAIEPSQESDEREDERSLAGANPMSGDLINLTLPAHDRSLPKPRGLLPVPEEIAEAVACEEARITREHGFMVAPEARQRMLSDLTLRHYYDGAYVASRHTPLGVEILAVGRDEARQYREYHPPEVRQDVMIGTVETSRFEVPLIPANDDVSDAVAERQEKARLGSAAGAPRRARERS